MPATLPWAKPWNRTPVVSSFKIARIVARLGLSCLVASAWIDPKAFAQSALPFPVAGPLTAKGDLSATMVEGIDRFLTRATEQALVERPKFWHRDFTSRARYEESVASNREHLRKAIGALDARVSTSSMEYVGAVHSPVQVCDTDRFTVFAVRWPVFETVYGEGLLLQPKGQITARVVAVPDADQTPELIVGLSPGLRPESQFARRLAENGCQVIVPTLVSREDTWSGNEDLKRFTNQPHREWIYRQAFELGRHVIGYEAQKILAAVDWLANENARDVSPHPPKIGLAGYGEGGLIAFYSAAIDTRVDAVLVSGYFGSRQRVWEEPIYRNVFGLLREFGDAEIATLIAPRALIIEHSEWPRIDGPPLPRPGRTGAAPGKLSTPERFAVEAELERAQSFFPASLSFRPELIYANEGQTVPLGSPAAVSGFLERLQVKATVPTVPPNLLIDARVGFDAAARQKRQVEELVRYTQHLLLVSDRVRDEFFWRRTRPNSTSDWPIVCQEFKSKLWDDVIGRFPPASVGPNVQARLLYEKPAWTAYEVMLDVWPDVYAWGILLLPKNLKPGERRPVVVCQHGLEGVPADTVNDDPNAPGFGPYQAFAARLADRGFIIFAPHNPYRGGDKFRVLQRKANPLGKSLFSIILAQHDRILDWLSSLPCVDSERIGFYGLSYGGKTAMRVPSLLNRYCLSICSADFNDWVKKNATTESTYSYMFANEYELPEFNLGETFNYAEMAALIAPRPFMVERGHHDGVAPDEWVAYEYAKVRRCYAALGIPERTRIEFFNGPHTIHGVGTFDFLQSQLRWQAPSIPERP